ncbi:GntR family transcriptional regulator [Corticibacter populi]|uniref:GntR family transcriptional regulator n=1 Tax=Corticibacter populi TaxID=1550736 RepID=UPI0010D7C2A0|nr:GntR family transcriptional regulator [Corticibacter populi]RZS35157.1 GntR family transcriptional regulator [Corticibacter populi]
MTEALDRDQATPLYVQVAALLRREILAHHYGDGGALPSEAHLQRRFGISRVTTRQALQLLADDGLVQKRQGKGTYVSSDHVRHALGKARGFYDELVCQGVTPQTELLFWGPSSEAHEEGLGTRLERLYRLDGAPIALVQAWLPDEALLLGRESAEQMTIYGLVEEGLKRRIVSAESSIGAKVPDLTSAGHLGLEGNGGFVLTLSRRSHDALGALCERALFLVRPERYEFVLRSEGRAPGTNMRIRHA